MGDAPSPAALRVPPHSAEAEQMVLGSVLVDNAAYHAAAELIVADGFYIHAHRLIWRAAERLIVAGKPADVITVHDALAADAEDAGGLQYLHGLTTGVLGAANVQAYAKIVLQRAQCRRLISIGHAMAAAGYDASADVDAAVERSVMDLLALQSGGVHDEPQPIAGLLPTWIDETNARAAGKRDAVSLGSPGVDRVLAGGGRRGELIVLGARPSMGKSAFALQVVRSIAACAGPVLVCSMEDSAGMLISRQVASVGRINLAHLRRPDIAPDSIWSAVTDAIEELQALPIWIDDRAGLGLRDVRRKASYVRRRAGDLVAIVVDYLQLMEGDAEEKRAYELNAVVRGLKRLAKDMGCIVFLLSQLSRKADETAAPPRLDHLAESGGIEQAADIILLLWREGKARPKPDNAHKAQVEIAKHKNGPTRTVPLHFDGATQRFMEVAEDAEPQ